MKYGFVLFLITFLTVCVISYMEGRIDEQLRRREQQQDLLSHARTDNKECWDRYQALVDESDPVTIMAGALRFEREER